MKSSKNPFSDQSLFWAHIGSKRAKKISHKIMNTPIFTYIILRLHAKNKKNNGKLLRKAQKHHFWTIIIWAGQIIFTKYRDIVFISVVAYFRKK